MALQLPVTYYVIYYDNMGIEPYDSGYLYEMQLFKTVKDAQDKIDELVGGRNFRAKITSNQLYSVRKVKITLEE